MSFTSFEFFIFLPLVFTIYWSLKSSLKLQNLLIVLASYLFYGWWDWRFLSLIAGSTLIDYTIGILIQREKRKERKKALLTISLIVNLGALALFKYYNFFIESLQESLLTLGYEPFSWTINIILPVGISFYTFQTLSYSIDVYRGKIYAVKDLVAFAAFVSFFPQLVAGPIERAINLLPQFESNRKFDYPKAVDGMRQVLWGGFKKIVIADNCAQIANITFESPSSFYGSTLVLGVVCFAFQIYCDFSGYSDIAIGTSRLFGFSLMKNFSFPYFSRDIAEFWRRWHISLTTWFRDYIYIPLGGSKVSQIKVIRNVFIVFILSGLWHGANWTFIFWGLLNALFFIPYLLSGRNRNHLDIEKNNDFFTSVKETLGMTFTFSLICLSWIFFRSENLANSLLYLSRIFSNSLFYFPELHLFSKIDFLLAFLLLFICIEWIGRTDEFAIQKLGLNWEPMLRLGFYATLAFVILWFGAEEQEFIYFQF